METLGDVPACQFSSLLPPANVLIELFTEKDWRQRSTHRSAHTSSVLGMIVLHQKGRPLHTDTCEPQFTPRANPTLPQNSNAAFSRYADVPKQGPYERPTTSLWQEHWPTPTAAAWQQTEQLVAQVSAVLDWMNSPVQRPRLHRQDAQQLWQTLMYLLSTLVLGHVMDLSLNMRNVFCASFSAVLQGWAVTQDISCHTDFELEANRLWDSGMVTQMALALLRRLGSDENICSSHCCSYTVCARHNVC